MEIISFIVAFLGITACAFKLATAVDCFLRSGERDMEPECFRSRLASSDIVRGVTNLGFSGFGLLVGLFGLSHLIPLTVSPAVGIVFLFNVISGVLNYFFVERNQLNKEVKRIEKEWETDKRISIFHDHEEEYYKAIKHNIDDRNNSIAIAIVLAIVLLLI